METKNKHIEIIRKACILSNPEIVELKEGCILSKGGLVVPGGYVYWDTPEGNIIVDNTDFGDDIEILGRPIRLADVLLAIDKKYINSSSNNHFRSKFEIINASYEDGSFKHDAYWNLRNDSLTEQSPETIEFISNLLTK